MILVFYAQVVINTHEGKNLELVLVGIQNMYSYLTKLESILGAATCTTATNTKGWIGQINISKIEMKVWGGGLQFPPSEMMDWEYI